MKDHKKNRGQAIVEFALVLVLFLTIVLGTIDFGFFLYSTLIMDSAVRDATRTGVTYSDWTTNYDGRVTDLKNIVSARAQLLPLNVRTGLTSRVFVTLSPNNNDIQMITVEIRRQPFTSLSGFLNIVMPNSISTRATMRYERR